MEQQNLIQRLKSCEEMPLFRKILLNQTSFEDEVENFYGYERWISHSRFGPYTYYKFNKKENKENYEKYPKDLVDILNHTVDTPFCVEKLEYKRVRDDYNNAYKENKKRTRITMLGTLGVVPSLSLVNAETPYPLTGIVMSCIFLTIAIKYLIAKNKYGENYKELKRLSATAQTLDDNMEQYRLNFIKEKLNE